MPADWDEPTISASLLRFHNPSDTCVLDIGCGDGKRTSGYIKKALSVVGIDPKMESLIAHIASHATPPGSPIRVVQSIAESLPFQDSMFETALLSWSL